MEAAQMKMGFRRALGQAGWHAPPEQEAIYYRTLAWHMTTRALDVMHTHGLAALCCLMARGQSKMHTRGRRCCCGIPYGSLKRVGADKTV